MIDQLLISFLCFLAFFEFPPLKLMGGIRKSGAYFGCSDFYSPFSLTEGMFLAQYKVLRENGHSPSEAFNETVEEATQSLFPLIGEKGFVRSFPAFPSRSSYFH